MRMEISDIVDNLCSLYIDEYGYESERDINCGDCELFANSLAKEISKKTTINDPKIINIFELSKTNGEDFNFDINMLNEFCIPLKNSIVSNLNKIDFGYHCWVYADGKHYDSECSEGTSNPFELPFFERKIKDYLMFDLSIDIYKGEYIYLETFEILEI